MRAEDNQRYANSKSYAIFHTVYAGLNGNLYAVWETACGIKGFKGVLNYVMLCFSLSDDGELEAERSCESQASEDSSSEILEEKSKGGSKSHVVGM